MTVWYVLRRAVVGMCIGISVVDTFGYVARIQGTSMQPTLNNEKGQVDYVFVNNLATRISGIQRGDIVSFISPKSPDERLIKRVIAVSNDTVYTRGYKWPVLNIPEGYVWVEGDHKEGSMDSNVFGPIPIGLITAKVTCIVWPPKRWQYLHSFIPEPQSLLLPKRLQWELPGTVCRHGLTIGDVDNDGDNELVVGTAEGELYIFKGSELWQKITGLGLVTSVAIGDIFNYGRNALVVICGDGWAHIFYSPRPVNPNNISASTTQQLGKESSDYDNFKVGYTTLDAGTGINTANSPSSDQVDSISEFNELSGKMECVHVQRIPTNTKVVLVADVDRDGANEMILGLTDRVVRSYRWSSNVDLGMGKLVGLNKWECANQIGTVTLQHAKDGTPTLLVAQPGGTFMRIKCNPEDCRLEDDSCEANSEAAASCVDYQTLGISRMRSQNISTEIIGDLESGLAPFVSTVETKLSNYEKKITPLEQSDDLDTDYAKSSSLEFGNNRLGSEEETKNSLDIPEDFDKYAMQDKEIESLRINVESLGTDQVDGNILGGNVILGENDRHVEKPSLLPSYKDFSHKYHNNNNNENEMRKNETVNVIDAMTKTDVVRGKPYALATLDGTIMLVRDENILWAMQVDHQIFALCRLDVTSDGADEIVACAWDGQTYILDQQQNSVRFQFEEPVRAFCTGYYSVSPGASTPCLVYNTFNNKIFLYYDVTLPSMVIRPLNAIEALDPEERKIIDDLLGECTDAEKQQKMQQLNEWLLYGAH